MILPVNSIDLTPTVTERMSALWPGPMIASGCPNDKANALQWLKRAAEAHDVGLLYIKVDPFLGPLRGEPEFQALVKRVGLVQ